MGHADGLHRRSFGLAARREGLRGAAGLEMRAMAVEFPVVHGHPNRLPFEGVLTLIDVPGDKAPSGARGHRVVLTREAAWDYGAGDACYGGGVSGGAWAS